MSDITRDYPGDKRRRDIHANTVLTTCPVCGEGVHRKNVMHLNDGRSMCGDCFDAVFAEELDRRWMIH
jgi:formylmethanofuran dehydrogenase subunit E